MKRIKVFGAGCPKSKTTYSNTLEAIEQSGIEAEVEKVEDIMEIIKHNILVIPVLMIDGEVKVKGRVPYVSEIIELLKS